MGSGAVMANTPPPPPGFVPLNAAPNSPPPPPPGFVPMGQEKDGFSVREMVGNIPESGANVLGGIWDAVTNPVDTAKGIGDLAKSAAVRYGRTLQEGIMGGQMYPDDLPDEQAARGMEDYFGGRYGSQEGFLGALEQDPVGVATELSGLLSGTGTAARIPALKQVANKVAPTRLPVEAPRAVIPQGAPEAMYQSAAKFSTRKGVPHEERLKMIQTALRQNVMPGKRGLDKVNNRIDILNDQLDGLIQESSAVGATVPVQRVEQFLHELRKSEGGVRLGAKDDLAVIDRVAGEFRDHMAWLGKTELTADDLQYFKTRAYDDINWEAQKTPIEKKVYKNMARSAKDEIARLIPEASDLNRSLSELYRLRPEIEAAAKRMENHNILSLDTSVKTAAGAGIGGGPGAALGMAISLLGKPQAKARIAWVLYKLKNGDEGALAKVAGDPAVHAALSLAGRADELFGASSGDPQ